MPYSKLCTLFYDLDKPSIGADELGFWRKFCEVNGGPVLEPMCGSGRVLVPLLGAGIDVDGFDLSESMLAACRTKLSPEQASRVSHDSFESFRPARTYACALIPTGSIGLLSKPGLVEDALGRIAAWLAPGGMLACDVELNHHEKSFSWPSGGRWIVTPEGDILSLHWTGHYTHKDQVTHTLGRYELIRDGKIVETEIELQELRLLKHDAIPAIFAAAGFEVLSSSEYLGEPVDPTTAETVTVIARRERSLEQN